MLLPQPSLDPVLKYDLGNTIWALAAGDFEIADPRSPGVAGARLGRREVFVHVPEGAVVDRVHGHAGVAAPVVGVLLVGRAGEDFEFNRRGRAPAQIKVGRTNRRAER